MHTKGNSIKNKESKRLIKTIKSAYVENEKNRRHVKNRNELPCIGKANVSEKEGSKRDMMDKNELLCLENSNFIESGESKGLVKAP